MCIVAGRSHSFVRIVHAILYIHTYIHKYTRGRSHRDLESFFPANFAIMVRIIIIYIYIHIYTFILYIYIYIESFFPANFLRMIRAIIHIYTHTRTHAYMRAYIHTCIHKCTSTRTHVSFPPISNHGMCIWYTCTFHTCVCTRCTTPYTHTYTYRHSYIHTMHISILTHPTGVNAYV